MFINFGPWRGKTVKISIWSEGLAALSTKPDVSWVWKWIAVTGLIEPPYQNKRFQYTHLSISITQASQVHILQEADARYRLSSNSTPRSIAPSNNQNVLTTMRGGAVTSYDTNTSTSQPVSRNATVLQTMKQQQQSTGTPLQMRTSQQQPQQPQRGDESKGIVWFWWLAIGAAILLFLSSR